MLAMWLLRRELYRRLLFQCARSGLFWANPLLGNNIKEAFLAFEASPNTPLAVNGITIW